MASSFLNELIDVQLEMAKPHGAFWSNNTKYEGLDAAASWILNTKHAHYEARKGWWTLWIRTGVQLPLNSGCDRHAD